MLGAGWLKEALLGGRAQGNQVSVVRAAGLGWALPLKKQPLLFSPCFPLSQGIFVVGQALPVVSWHRVLSAGANRLLLPYNTQAASPGSSQRRQLLRTPEQPRTFAPARLGGAELRSSVPDSRNHPLSLPRLLIPRPTQMLGDLSPQQEPSLSHPSCGWLQQTSWLVSHPNKCLMLPLVLLLPFKLLSFPTFSISLFSTWRNASGAK